MNDEHLLPVAIAGLTAAAASAVVMTRPPNPPDTWFRVHWPNDLAERDISNWLRRLAGDRSRSPIALEVVSTVTEAGEVTIDYRVGVPEHLAREVAATLRSFVAGAHVELIGHSAVSAPRFAWELGFSASDTPLRTEAAESAARGVLTALADIRPGETIVFQWILGPRLSPSTRPEQPVRARRNRQRQNKTDRPGFRVIGRLGVAGANERRAQTLARRLTAGLRTLEAPGIAISVRRTKPVDVALARCPRRWPSTLNVDEITAATPLPTARTRTQS